MDLTKSQCKSGWLHRWDIVGESELGVLERCSICHQKKSFRIVENSISNRDYLQYHKRSALQRDHRLFLKEYPHLALNRAGKRALA